MRVNSLLKSLASRRSLLIFLVSAILLFFMSDYVAKNYGLPQWIIIQIKSEKDMQLDVYYDIGKGYGEKYKTSRRVSGSADFQTVRLPLPLRRLKSFRIDPLSEPGTVNIKSVELTSFSGSRRLWLADEILKDFRPRHDIGRFELANGSLLVESTGSDPFFSINAEVPEVNKVRPIELMLVAVSLFFILFLSNMFMTVIVRNTSNFIRNISNRVSKSDIREKYLIAVIIGFVLILNYPKLHLYFLGDDFAFIFSYQHLTQVFDTTAMYHVTPVPQFFIFYLGNLLAGFNPLYYQIITLLLHLVNVLLVYKLTKILFRNKWTSMVASLLFAAYFMNYEVVYWIAGVFYILLTFFYISTLLFLIKYLNEKKKIYYALFITSFAFTVFTMEQGVTLLGACIILEIFLPDNLKKFRSSDLKQKALFFSGSITHYIIPFFIIALFFILKQIMDQRFILNAPTFGSVVKTISGMVWHLFIPYPYWINNGILYNSSGWNYRIYLFVLIFAVITYFFIRRYRRQDAITRNNRLLFGSDEVTYIFLFSCILVYVIPLSIATIIQARYFYLPSVFSSIILGNLLVKNLSYMAVSKNYTRQLFHSLVVIFIAASVPLNTKFLNAQYNYWETASEITKNIINDTGLYLSEKNQIQNIYYVNLPDGIYSQNDFGWPDAYVFRNGIDMAVRLTYPAKKIGVIVAKRTENPIGVRICPDYPLVSGEQIRQFATDEKNVVLLYDDKIRTVRKVGHRL